MDRSRHSITEYLGDEKIHKAINENFFKRLNEVKKDLYEVELLKSTIEHREPIIEGFFLLQYAKLSKLELYYNFFDKYCDENKFEEFELDTDSLYLALVADNLDDCILPEKKAQWTLIRRNDCRDDFIADENEKFFPSTCCAVHKKHDKREPGLFTEILCSKTYCCYISTSNNFVFRGKRLNKRTLEDTGHGPMSNYRRVFDEAVNLKSTNRGFKTSNHLVGTYEQTKKRTKLILPEKRSTE